MTRWWAAGIVAVLVLSGLIAWVGTWPSEAKTLAGLFLAACFTVGLGVCAGELIRSWKDEPPPAGGDA